MKTRKEIKELHDICDYHDFPIIKDENVRKAMLAVCCWILECDKQNLLVVQKFINENKHLIK